MANIDEIELCVVCMDKARGHNYGVLTCSSCKSFFRRHAFNRNKQQCYLSGGKCQINSPNDRKYCRKCRLEKCFAVGMKKEYILDFNNKVIKLIDKKCLNNNEHNVDSTTIALVNKNYELNNDFFEQVFENSNISEENIREKVMEIEMNLKSSKTQECLNSSLTIMRPITDYKNNLTELEGNKLMELLNATRMLKKGYSEQTRIEIQKTKLNSEFHRIRLLELEVKIKNIVEMTKTLSAFQTVCENDRIALIKYGLIQIRSLLRIKSNELGIGYWTLCNNPELNIVVTVKTRHPLFREFLKKIISEWDSDDVIMDLLSAIALFNPNRPDLNHRDVIQLQQMSYQYLLKRYLLLRYRSECESESRFKRLMNCLEVSQYLAQNRRQKFIKEKSMFEYTPFLQEFFT